MAVASSAYILRLVILFLSYLVDGFPTGAPLSTCWTRYPKHSGLGTQTTPCPIGITFSTPSYSPGAEVIVTIEDPNKRWFSGIEMGAFRDSGNHEEIVGEFVKFPDNKLKTITCFGGFKNMITHKTGLKVQKLEVTWKAPSDNVGNLTFKEVIKHCDITLLPSVLDGADDLEVIANLSNRKAIKAIKDTGILPDILDYSGIVSNKLVQDIDFSGCGDTKGCFLYPHHCSGDDCVAAVSFQHRPGTNDYVFEMFSTIAQNWISLGFSDDAAMGFDETVSCVSNSGQINIQHGWNPGYHNERMLTRYISEAEVRQNDGRLHCRFVLPRITSAYLINQESSVLNYTNITYDKETDKYLMLAWGKAMPASDVLSKHVDMPAVTYAKVNTKDASIYHGSSFPILVRVHAALMMVAWIFLGGIVTVISRHYRDWMPRVRLLGTKVWFQVHRELAILIVILTTIGIIVIFSHYGSEIRKLSVPHAYVGLTVFTAVLVQAIAGFLRPGPDHKIRFLFNWGHRFLGQSAHILAAVTMFLAFDIEYFNENMKTFGFAVLSVWVALQLLWHIAFEVLTCRGMPLGSSQENTESDKNKDSGKCNLHTFLFVGYIIVLAGLCTAALLAFLLF